MSRLRWFSTLAFEQLGWAGVVAVLLFLSAGSYYAYGLWETEQGEGSLRRSPVVSAASPSASAHDTDGRLELEELERLLKAASLEDNLQALHDAGRAAGLELKRLEYRMAEEKRWRLKQYQIIAPINSSYPRVRDFVGIALAKVPSLALDHISFQKQKVGDATVAAELRFTLFISYAP